ncbi:MAG: helix-turn-helix domain-containing protein [Pseudomonadales bacterium]
MNTASRDGRHQRSEQSRQRIIDAMIELIQEGVLEPTAEQVSARAGLAIRTVFRHFNDMDSLFREISRRMTARAQAIVGGDPDGDSAEATLHDLIDRRSRLYEDMLPMRLAADALRHRSPFLQEDHARFVDQARRTLRDACPARVIDDTQGFEAVDALLSYELWMRLRREQKLSPRAAVAVVHRLVDAVLAEGA